MSKSKVLRALINSYELEFFMEAHSAISARIVEEAGFPAIWASGLSISATLGLADRNIASWSQILDIASFMADSTNIPILIDGDTGYGNCNNVQHVVRKLCQSGIAGICIEDKLFPKTNSFIKKGNHLAETQEFAGRIRAAQDAKIDLDFCVIARIEALICGASMQEALYRASAYFDAGADAILIHSKSQSEAEIVEFCRQWGQRLPVIIVPTKYYRTPSKVFRKAGISCAIWANHTLRASISAMRSATQIIRQAESVMPIENNIASLTDIFSLTSEDSAQAAELKYLPRTL